MCEWVLPERFETPAGVVRWGRQGSGPPVVLLHGTPFSSVVWREIAAALAKRHEVYVWDMLGYGQSDMDQGQDVSLGAQQEIFAALLGHWNLDEPVVVAHDFGGVVALGAALLAGKRYSRLVLLDAVALGDWGTGFFRLAHDNPETFTNLPEHLHEAMLRRFVPTASYRGLSTATVDELVGPWLGSVGQPAFYRQIAQNSPRFTQEVESRYSELDLPVLVGWGVADEWLPPDFGERLAAAIPAAELRWFGGAGHLVQLDAPGQVIAALDTFLRGR